MTTTTSPATTLDGDPRECDHDACIEWCDHPSKGSYAPDGTWTPNVETPAAPEDTTATWTYEKLRTLAAYIIHDRGTTLVEHGDTNDDLADVAFQQFTDVEAAALTTEDVDTVRGIVARAQVVIDGVVIPARVADE